MRSYFVGGIAGAALLLGTMGAAYAGCSGDNRNRWMTVDNRGRATVTDIRIKPSRRQAPSSRNLLGGWPIPAYGRRRVEFDYCSGECLFDIAIRGRPGGSRRHWFRARIDACRRSVLPVG